MTVASNGHQLRRARKIEAIMRVATDLIHQHGLPKVAMDDIAEAANVSKMTIYKYFGSKENLVGEIIKSEFDRQFVNAETVVQSEMEFIEKLRQIIELKSSSASFLDGQLVSDVMSKSSELSHHIGSVMSKKIEGLMISLFNEGRRKGFLDKSISDELLLTYVEIFRRGLHASADEMRGVVNDSQKLRKLIDLYFFGLIRPQPNAHQ